MCVTELLQFLILVIHINASAVCLLWHEILRNGEDSNTQRIWTPFIAMEYFLYDTKKTYHSDELLYADYMTDYMNMCYGHIWGL